MKRHWYDHLWVVSLTYLILGFFNILFAWLGLFCFFIPLIISAVKGTKGYCNRYCGRGQLFGLLGGRFGLSRRKDIPKWMKSKGFRYGFLVFFFAMFFVMLWNTYLVFAEAQDLKQVGGDAAVDVQAALAVGLSRNIPPSRRGAVRLWILQRDADLHCSWPDHHGAVQTPQLVCVLPYGDHDPTGLQGAEQQSVMSSRNGRYSLGKI